MADCLADRMFALRWGRELSEAAMENVVKGLVARGAIHWSVVWDEAVVPLLKSGFCLPDLLDVSAVKEAMQPAVSVVPTLSPGPVASRGWDTLATDLLSVACSFLDEASKASFGTVAYEWFRASCQNDACRSVVTRRVHNRRGSVVHAEAPWLAKRASAAQLKLDRLVVGAVGEMGDISPLTHLERVVISRVTSVRDLTLAVPRLSAEPLFAEDAVKALRGLTMGPGLKAAHVQFWARSFRLLENVQHITLRRVPDLSEDVLAGIVRLSWNAEHVSFIECLFAQDLTESVVEDAAMDEAAGLASLREAELNDRWVNVRRLVLRDCWLSWNFLDVLFRRAVYQTVVVHGGCVTVPYEYVPSWTGSVERLVLR